MGRLALCVVDALVRLSNLPPLFRRLVLTEPEVGPPASPVPQRHHQTHLTDDKRVDLLERYMSGERAFELARAFNLDRRTVASILSRAGVRRPRSMSAEDRAEATQLYEQGWSCARIGEHLGRNHSTVWLALKAAGVELREPWSR